MSPRTITVEGNDEIIVASMKQNGIWPRFLELQEEMPDQNLVLSFRSPDGFIWVIQCFLTVPGDNGFVLTKIPLEMHGTLPWMVILTTIQMQMRITNEEVLKAFERAPMMATPPQN